MKLFWLLQLLIGAGFLYIALRNRAMKKRQDELVKGLGGLRYWRINLARPAFHSSWLRVMLFEAKGVLIDEGDRVRIKSIWPGQDQMLDVSLEKTSSTVQWLGNSHLRAGNLCWAQLSTPQGELLFSADTGMYAPFSREAMSDIFRSAFPSYPLDEQKTADFALEKNPASVRMIALFFALFFFSLIDTFAISRFELSDDQIMRIMGHPLTWLGVLAGLGICLTLAYRHMQGRGVPARESMVIGMLVASALLGAALPMAKRADQWLADAPAQPQLYRVTKLAQLEPVQKDKGLPNMRFPRAREYWEQYPVGSEYSIPFLHGPLGLWQLDHAAFDGPLIAFYEKRKP